MFLLQQTVISLAALTLMGNYGVSSANTCDIDIENTLRTLLSPQENSMQVQALRRDVLRKLQEAIDRLDEEDDETGYKRSLSSLAARNNLPEHKRTLGNIPRPYLRDEDGSDAVYMNYIAKLLKNEPFLWRGQKRGIESLARNGDLHPRKEVQEMLDELYGKRNIGSLARGYNFPSYGKKSLSSLAKSGDLNYQRVQYKRNIASLARDGKFTGKRFFPDDEYSSSLHKLPETGGLEEKRNLQSIKAQYKPKYKRSIGDAVKRNKRDADYFEDDNVEYPSPVYQNPNVYDYEEWMQNLAGAYPNAEKRFLGSIARTGWFRPSNSRYSRFASPDKRHIGSLARLGWLPSFRNVRRFNRSGRSTTSDDICREVAPNGQTEDYGDPKESSVSLEDKRYLLQPAVDNILLRKVFMHPRSH